MLTHDLIQSYDSNFTRLCVTMTVLGEFVWTCVHDKLKVLVNYWFIKHWSSKMTKVSWSGRDSLMIAKFIRSIILKSESCVAGTELSVLSQCHHQQCIENHSQLSSDCHMTAAAVTKWHRDCPESSVRATYWIQTRNCTSKLWI